MTVIINKYCLERGSSSDQVFHLIMHRVTIPFHFCSPNYQTDEAKLFQVNVFNSCDFAFKSIVPSFLSEQFDAQLSSGMNIENACLHNCYRLVARCKATNICPRNEKYLAIGAFSNVEFRRMAIVERGAAREHFLSRVEGERERETAKKPFANSSLKLGERRAADKRAIILGTIATEHVAANCRY